MYKRQFYGYSLLESSIIRATLLFYLSPLWSTVIGVIWLNEKFTQSRILSICLGLAGLFLLLSQNDSISNPLNLSLIHISEPTRLLSISYAVFCLKKKKQIKKKLKNLIKQKINQKITNTRKQYEQRTNIKER